MDKRREDWLIPSSPSFQEESSLDKLGKISNLETPLVMKENLPPASIDGLGGEIDAIPLSSDQATRLEDCNNSNGSPHWKVGSINEDRADQEEDLAHKEEEVNYNINYLCDSVTKEIMDKLLDEIFVKEELHL